MKRFLLLFAVLCCTMMASANGPLPTDEIWYTSTNGQVVNPYKSNVFGATIISNTYQNGKGVIKFDGTVTSIGTDAFWMCSSLNGITIPNSVTNIGPYAFADCPNLTDIAIPNAVESIENFAFNNSGITSITIPSSVTYIRNTAFEACPNLTSINIEQGNLVYDSRNNCNAIINTETNTLISGCKNSVIPTSVTSIGESAFRGCALTSITIPNSVTTIGESAFTSCTALTSIEIPNSVTTIGGATFTDCTALISIEIPNSVATIEISMFYGCTALTSLVIPSSVTTIGILAFAECTALESITFMQNTPPSPNDPSLDSFWFLNCSNLSSIYVPNAAVNTYKGEWSLYANIIKAIDIDEHRAAAIAEIQNAFDGETGSAYLNGLVADEMTALNNAATIEIITANKAAALAKLSTVVPAYKAGKAEILGEMGTECHDCPAVDVTKCTTTIRLYNPEKVEFMKTE